MFIASTICASLISCSRHDLRKLAGRTPCLPLGLSQSSQMGTRQVPRMSGRQTVKLLITRNQRPHQRGQLFLTSGQLALHWNTHPAVVTSFSFS